MTVTPGVGGERGHRAPLHLGHPALAREPSRVSSLLPGPYYVALAPPVWAYWSVRCVATLLGGCWCTLAGQTGLDGHRHPRTRPRNPTHTTLLADMMAPPGSRDLGFEQSVFHESTTCHRSSSTCQPSQNHQLTPGCQGEGHTLSPRPRPGILFQPLGSLCGHEMRGQ